MGISIPMIHWIEGLHAMGIFAGKRTILELGPQDIVAPLPVVFNFLQSVSPSIDIEDRLAADFFDQGQPRPMAMRAFYAALGMKQYSAIDLGDDRADYRFNLNEPISLGRKFDIVTNFGTLEHVFNIGSGMTCIHNHLEVGGIALHVLPTRGEYNHGFYNFHSTWCRDVALANSYEIVDMTYMADFIRQHVDIWKLEKKGDGLPRRTTMADIRNNDLDNREEYFSRSVIYRLLHQRWRDKNADTRVFDCIFAAMRKRRDAPFVHPMQKIYASPK